MKNNQSMTSEESLDLIARMLHSAQERFRRGMGTPFIVFGYLTAAISLSVWGLQKATGDFRYIFMFFSIPVIAAIWLPFQIAKKPKTVTTFFDRAVSLVWITLGACCSLIGVYAAAFNDSFPSVMVTSLIMFAGEAITGGILKLRYIQIMGAIGMLLSFGAPFITGVNQLFIMTALSLLVMVIPGHIMNARTGKAIQRDSHV